MTNLTLEQEFKLKRFTQEVSKLSEQQVKDFLIRKFEESMLQQNKYNDILAKKWGIK